MIRAYEAAPARHFQGVRASFAPDGKRVLTSASWNDSAQLWDAGTGRRVATFAGHSGGISGSEVNDDGTFVVTTSFDENDADLGDRH